MGCVVRMCGGGLVRVVRAAGVGLGGVGEGTWGGQAGVRLGRVGEGGSETRMRLGGVGYTEGKLDRPVCV